MLPGTLHWRIPTNLSACESAQGGADPMKLKRPISVSRVGGRQERKQRACVVSFLLLITCIGGIRSAQAQEHVVQLHPGQDVNAVVAESPEGSNFRFAPGIYRMVSIQPKDEDVFFGTGAVLSGAKSLSMRPDGGRWSAFEKLSVATPRHCEQNHPRCWIPNDLFIDSQPQQLADSEQDLKAGDWYYDETSQKIVIPTDPDGHSVELSVTPIAFSGAASRVEIRDLVVEKYASEAQHGAIGGVNGKATGWKIYGVEARLNHGVGVAVGAGSRVERCSIHNNGQLGIAGKGEGLEILDNEIATNNYAGYAVDWEAGGTKFSKTDNLLVKGNRVHDNFGNGLWTDIDNIHSSIENNEIVSNSGEGIRHEISYDATIRNNIVTGNSLGIVVALSPNTEVSGNFVDVPSGGKGGIRILDGNRGSGLYGPHIAHDDHVHDNVIQYRSADARSGFVGDIKTASGILFDHDEFHILAGGEFHWTWGGVFKTMREMQEMGQETHGTSSTDARNINLRPAIR